MKESYKERINNVKPVVVVSKCLGFEACRYNGQFEKCDLVEKLKDFVDFITVCPEVELGLGTHRESIRLVKESEATPLRLIQQVTGRELSNEMTEFAEEFLFGLPKVDGFILKSKSPSCGMKEVKIYKKDRKRLCIS